MPAELERCIAQVMARPDFSPQEGRTAEQSAIAICRSSLGLMTDGSEDGKDQGMADDEIKKRLDKEIAFSSGPTLRKRMGIAHVLGTFVNGEQQGVMTRARLQSLVDRFRKHPRQVPMYRETPHEVALQKPPADGWIESLSMDGDWLMADTKTHGQAAADIMGDRIRLASIGTVQGKDYDGTPIGEVLDHVVLSNRGFIKDLNVAASAKGDERPLIFFTALKEAPVADDKNKKPDHPAPEGGDAVVRLTAEVDTLKTLTQTQTTALRDLEAANANLMEENEKLRKSAANPERERKVLAMERQLKAERIRRRVGKGLLDGQFVREQVIGHDHDSDEVVLKWFAESPLFKDDEDKLANYLEFKDKKPGLGRRYHSGGSGGDEPTTTLTQEQIDYLRKRGISPERFAALNGVTSFTEYKEKAVSGKGK